MKPSEPIAEHRAQNGRMAPLHPTRPWEVLHALVPQQPAVRTQPLLWRWDEVLPFIEVPGRAITAEAAVHRVRVLENPGCS